MVRDITQLKRSPYIVSDVSVKGVIDKVYYPKASRHNTKKFLSRCSLQKNADI